MFELVSRGNNNIKFPLFSDKGPPLKCWPIKKTTSVGSSKKNVYETYLMET